MGLARVALVAVERPRRVVLGLGAHQSVAADLGEDAGGGDDEAAGVGLDHPLDAADVRRHEVPAAVDDRRVRHDGQLGDRPAGGETLRRRHPQLVALDLGGMPDAPRRAPRGDTIEQPLAVTLGEHLRVADAVEPPVAGQHRGADRERAGPRAAPDLVDADDDRVAELPQLLLDAPGRGILLRQRPPWSATESHAAQTTTETGDSCERPAERPITSATRKRTCGELRSRLHGDDGGLLRSNRVAAPCSRGSSTPCRADGHDVDNVSADVLAPIDHLHTFGPPATLRLAAAAGIAADDVVLDVGCGIGGPTRTLATHFGCQLVGVDMTASVLRGRRRTEPSQRTRRPHRDPRRRRHGVAVRGRRVHRRLDPARLDEHRPQGADVRRDAQGAGHRWAAGVLRRARRRASNLPTSRCRGQTTRVRACWRHRSETRRLVTDAGFAIRQWDDVTESAADYVTALAPETAHPSGLGMHLVVPDMSERAAVLARNIAEGRVTFVQCVADAV